ncbi:molybdopterin binding oxidoreductase [Ramicandelaber brevisporus]|nr:molybdopterin binding oxidoreductase [Ramicandelaber brevisporus]
MLDSTANTPAPNCAALEPKLPRTAPAPERDAFAKKRGKAFVYDNEPEVVRDRSVLIVQNEKPFNAEPNLPSLVQNFITPTPVFFKRNHGPIPTIEAHEYKLFIDGIGVWNNPLATMGDCGEAELLSMTTPTKKQPEVVLTLDDIKTKFERVEIIAAIQCAGNRRDGLAAVKEVRGVIWGPGTISNARWAGCRIRDVLAAVAGVPSDLTHPIYTGACDSNRPPMPALHLAMEAYGLAEEDDYYGSSVPLAMAMDPLGDAILAYEMNGEPLARDHGFPLRVVVPGVIGARSVKWLKRLTIQPFESDSFFQQRDYKILPPNVEANQIGEWWGRCAALQEMNTQSVICTPVQGETVAIGTPYTIRGYAISGGGRRVDRVDVSLDGGKTWLEPANLFQAAGNSRSCKTKKQLKQSINGTKPSPCDVLPPADATVEQDAARQSAVGYMPAATEKFWTWCLWSVHVPRMPANPIIVCRAWDASGNTQPEKAVWNFRGVMNNAYFTVSDLNMADSARL